MAMKHIKEYIDTGDGTAGTLLIPKMIFPTMVREQDKALLPRELAAFVVGPQPGTAFNFNLETENSMDVREVGEGAELPLDALEYENVTVTPKKYGVAIRITKEMEEDSQFPIFQGQIAAIGRRFAEKETELIIDQLQANAGATTAGGAAITLANITESMYDLESNDYKPTDLLVGNEVAMDMRNINTFVEAQRAGNTEVMMNGFIGTVYGMKVYRFSYNAISSSTYDKYAWVIDRSAAYAIYIKRDLTIENFSLPSYDMRGAAATMRIAVTYLRTNAISMITTS